jgi:hypothetical protein
VQAKLKLSDHEHDRPFEIDKRRIVRCKHLLLLDPLQGDAKRFQQYEVRVRHTGFDDRTGLMDVGVIPKPWRLASGLASLSDSAIYHSPRCLLRVDW